MALDKNSGSGTYRAFNWQKQAVSRRSFLSIAAGAAATLGLVACGSSSKGASSSTPQLDAPLPSSVPPGTQLVVDNHATEIAFKLSGLNDSLPFKVSQWTNLSAGPDVINAFRANSLDIASNAGIPPIQSYYQDSSAPGDGIDARIVAVRLTRVPTYIFATKPHSDIQSVKDFKGKKIGFSQGQAQGVVVLRALAGAGLTPKDVNLVELNSPQFLRALQAGQIDIAPLAITAIDAYLNQYGKDGAHKIATDVIDRLTILWAPAKVLANPAKLAAITAFIPLWAKALVWVDQNPDIYAQKYYVEDQGIKLDQAKAVIATSSKPLFPPTWDEALKWEQETADLLAQGGYVKSFKTDQLFDRRFEGLASNAVAAEYRS